MKYKVDFFSGRRLVFSQEIITDSIMKLTQYVRNTSAFLKTKHKVTWIDYQILAV